MRSIVAASAVVGLLTVATACSSGGNSGPHVTPSPPPSAGNRVTASSSNGLNVTNSSGIMDGGDPHQTGCDHDAVDVSDTSVAISQPDGTPFGSLILRLSRSCQAAWGDVLVGSRPPNFDSVTITVGRGQQPPLKSFTTPDISASPVYGNMALLNGTCVWASAYVIINGNRGPTATTPCRPQQ